MAEASLLFVRDDRVVADKLARALEGHGVTICGSASAYEGMDGYDAVVALFSSSAVRSPLLMEMALAAEAEGKLVPVFVGLCHLQAPLNKLALHDLCEWNGDTSDVALQAIRANIMRIARARTTGELLRAEMRGPEQELPPPPPPRPDPALLRQQEEEKRRAREREIQDATLARLERERQERAAIRAKEDEEAAARTRAHEAEIQRLRALENEARRAREEAEAAAGEKVRAAQAEAAAQAAAVDERLRREREHRERELASRAAPAPSAPRERDFGRDRDEGLGDPFGRPRQSTLFGDIDPEFETPSSRRAIGISDWASDVLVMTTIAVGGLAAIVVAAQPEAVLAAVQGLNQEIAALLARFSVTP